MSKILILSASPQRDKLIDKLLQDKLISLGNEVIIRPMPMGARQAVLDIKPEVLIMPPIRNYFSYDIAENCSRWGIAVVIRHVEPGCDEDDIAEMSEVWQRILLMGRPENIKLELFWNEPEANLLKSVDVFHKVIAVGAFVADLYKRPDLVKPETDGKSVLISSPWGLLDMDSDNTGQSIEFLKNSDVKGKNAWLAMVRDLRATLDDSYNITATLHPRIELRDYERELAPLGVKIDITSTAFDLLLNSDFLIHAGSTMAVEMHWLDKPAFQFGDVNSLSLPDGNWWQQRGSPISQISPFFLNGKELAEAILKSDGKSNANIEAIEKLENGRYGSMDGKATDRAVELINKLKGSFKIKWPAATHNFGSLFAVRSPRDSYLLFRCKVCKEVFYRINNQRLKELKQLSSGKFDINDVRFPCPWCGSPLNIPDMEAIDGKTQ